MEFNYRKTHYIINPNGEIPEKHGGVNMSKVRVAIIGQGRSGRDIHGNYFRSEENKHYEVVAVVDHDESRRARALKEYPGCRVYADYTELFGQTDIDLVINCTFSLDHYPVSKDLMEHGFNVLVEKPMARYYIEAATLLNVAKVNNVLLAVFQQTFLVPYFLNAKNVIASGKLGEIKQVKLRYNDFARRWDWQTLQENMAGGVYNTGPHPIGLALDFLDFSDDLRVAYSKLDTAFTSGDANDMAKIILVAPGKPVVDVEINSNDAYCPYNLKILGTKGCFQSTFTQYKMKYIVDGENPVQPVQPEFLRDENGLPIYCNEQLNLHEEEGEICGDTFAVATSNFYAMLYDTISTGVDLKVKPENIAKLVNVMEIIHAQNPLPVRYLGGKYV